MRKLLAFILACLAASPAWAISESGKTIAYVGVDAGGYGYIHFTTPLTGSCAYDVVYAPSNTDVGRAQFALAMTARTSGTIISRVDYTNIGGTCYLSVIQM